MQQLFPWILASMSLALLLAAGVMALITRKRNQPKPLPTKWTLTARPVFSTDERRVYRQLREALPHHIVLSKLPLVRFCQPTDPQEVRFWFDLLGPIHVTFAICSANGRVLAAIDLDNERRGSHRSKQIKQSALAACRVRYLRCTPDHLPSIPELQLLVPQSGSAARGTQPAPTAHPPRDSLSNMASTRRRDRTTLWQDSGFMQDSSFGSDGVGDLWPTSSFGSLRSGGSGRTPTAERNDAGGMTAETPLQPLRH